MNKGIFTLMTAALLASGSVVTPAFADATFATYQAVNTNKVLANGVKFYLQVGSDEATSTQTDTKYYKAKKLTIKDKATVWSLEETLNADEASVFEVGNYTKVGGQYTFSLSVDGNKISLTKDGVIKSDAATTTEASKTVTTLITDKNKLSELNTFSASLMNATAVNVVLATQEEVMTAAMLNEYNTEGFTFGFNAKTDLEGNAFAKPMYAVEIGDDAATLDAGTYFVVGGKDDAVKALEKAVKDEEGVEEALATEDIQLLALNIDKKYDVRGAKSPAYILQVINGDKITRNKAAFSVKEFDKLANEGEYELKIEDPNQDDTAEETEYVYVGAMRFTDTDTKTYVTTVKENEKSLLISATLGASTYLDASVLLKEGVANYVNVYFTSNNESEKDKFQTEYHKYLVPVSVKADARAEETYTFAFDAKAAKDVNFNSALSQWAVKGFDGKYTFTLVNRETAQEITLGLQESDVKGEYKVVNAVDENKDAVSFASLKKAATGEEAEVAKSVASTTVKFIPVEKVAGFLDLSKDEMAAGIQLEFTGKTPLIGEKTFFAKKDKKTEGETTTETLAPSMKASDAFTLAINKAKGKIKEDDKDAVVNYTIQPLVLSCLKDGKIVELKDTLFVPTYNIYYTTPVEGKDDIVTYLGKDLKFAKVNESEKPAEFVFRVNADGSYAMMGTDAAVSFDEDITANTKVVSVNSTTGTDFSTNEALLYNLSEGSFASVAVKVQDNSDKTTLPAEPRHASFDNALGSINYQLNKNGITEGILSAESMIFWLDTADSKATTPYFYISKGIEVAEGEEKPAERMFMYNATDSMSIFDENSAQASFNEKYMLEGTTKEDKIAKVIFRPATIAGVDTINTVVEGKAAVVAAKENKAEEVLAGLDNFKFGICLADDAVDGEYVIYSKADNKYVYAKNGKLGLGGKEEAMVFTLGTEVPTSNESIDNAASSVVVIGNAGSVTIQGAQGETAYVRNLLGMPLAETVVTSDNATIAVPAGIVLVTVGDETVKVVVK
ncbi:DUF6383 domain-containing protein [Parabacteroides sp. AF39-10AC]|uniref:DUF6383 domain-containing protein n=1 Tax=Parabacteroides sp. AF39-10AC TaxID=2293117 RepID=UPI000EFF0F1C|nr:DUF6383 domain-containing protein [Parabacteroides sp. AF39-10AC]RKU86832.1 hypothetical protein DW033_06365 [Parabacteroides sp. AF39-10AC]